MPPCLRARAVCDLQLAQLVVDGRRVDVTLLVVSLAPHDLRHRHDRVGVLGADITHLREVDGAQAI